MLTRLRNLGRQLPLVIALAAMLAFATVSRAQSTSFTYQGSLQSSGVAVNGTADVRVRIMNAATGGNTIGAQQQFTSVQVTNGVFSINVASPTGAFVDGAPAWLELDVRSPAGTGAYTTLAPRQAVTPVPQAVGLAGVPMTTQSEEFDIGPSATSSSSFFVVPGTEFSQVITPTQSGLLTQVRLQLAQAYNDPSLRVRLRSGQGVSGPVLADFGLVPTVGTLQLNFDSVRVTQGQPVTVEILMASGVIAVVQAAPGTQIASCPTFWSGGTSTPAWFAAYVRPLRLGVQSTGAPWTGITGRPALATLADGSAAFTSGAVQIRPAPSGNAGSALRLIGRGGANATVSLDLSTYDPGTILPSARILATDANFSSTLDFQTKIPGSITNSLMTRMRLTADGKLGIGTSSPDALLTVDPNAGGGVLVGNTSVDGRTSLYAGVTAASGGYSLIQSTSASGTSYGFLTINPDGGHVGIGTRSPSSSFLLDVNGPLRCIGFTNASSGRYKKDIRSVDGDLLPAILALRPVRFAWNESIPSMDGREDLGLIAEEVALVLPDAVSRVDGRVEGIDYNRLTALVIGALRQKHEQDTERSVRVSSELKSLRQENEALKARLDALERAINKR
jgi:hypothetical protein